MSEGKDHTVEETISEIFASESQLRKTLLEIHNKANLFGDWNPDIFKVKDFVAAFSKTLPHNSLGLVDRRQKRKLLQAFAENDRTLIDKIKLGSPGVTLLKNPSCSS